MNPESDHLRLICLQSVTTEKQNWQTKTMIEKDMKVQVHSNLWMSQHADLICLPVKCCISCTKFEKHSYVQKNINKDVHTQRSVL